MKKLSKGQQLKQVQREFDELKLAIKRYVEGAQREVLALRDENARLKELVSLDQPTRDELNRQIQDLQTLTRTKKALKMAMGGLAEIEVTARGMNMEGRIATSTLTVIKKELGE